MLRASAHLQTALLDRMLSIASRYGAAAYLVDQPRQRGCSSHRLITALDESVIRVYQLEPVLERRTVRGDNICVVPRDAAPKHAAVPFCGNELAFEVAAAGAPPAYPARLIYHVVRTNRETLNAIRSTSRSDGHALLLVLRPTLLLCCWRNSDIHRFCSWADSRTHLQASATMTFSTAYR